MAGSADGRCAEKHGGHDESDSIDGEEHICTDATNSGVEEAAERTMASISSVAANTRPKALEDAAALSMVANRATANSTNATKG